MFTWCMNPSYPVWFLDDIGNLNDCLAGMTKVLSQLAELRSVEDLTGETAN